MSDKAYVLAIDQGTTSSRAIVFDQSLSPVGSGQQEFEQHYPHSGWVEHDPSEIWQSTLHSCKTAIENAKLDPSHIKSIGITNQRETTLIWDRTTGEAIYPAIVWQDRRTADYCAELKQADKEPLITSKTGLLLDPYFSASKIRWILDNVKGARDQANRGELAFGTVDSFLIWKLTDGKTHATDVTNASRTSLFNIHSLAWDQELLDLFEIPASLLPVVKECADDFGHSASYLLGESIAIRGVAGDQQAAAIGQQCFSVGDVKSTYGTGCFVLVNTGEQCLVSKHQLLSTIAYSIQGKTHYALEGSIFVAGAAIQWLRDGLRIIDSAETSESLAGSLESNNEVYMVPAFTGLGAPYWDANAKGALFGLTRATGPAELSRAALESIAYLTEDLFRAIREEGITLSSLKIDGGMVANNWFSQFLADIVQLTLQRPAVLETTAMGAAYLAGLENNIYPYPDKLRNTPLNTNAIKIFEPAMQASARQKLLDGWRSAVNRTLSNQ